MAGAMATTCVSSTGRNAPRDFATSLSVTLPLSTDRAGFCGVRYTEQPVVSWDATARNTVVISAQDTVHGYGPPGSRVRQRVGLRIGPSKCLLTARSGGCPMRATCTGWCGSHAGSTSTSGSTGKSWNCTSGGPSGIQRMSTISTDRSQTIESKTWNSGRHSSPPASGSSTKSCGLGRSWISMRKR